MKQGPEHGPIEPFTVSNLLLLCSCNVHDLLGLDLCQFHSELLPCGFYQHLCHLYIKLCLLDFHVWFFVEALSLLINRSQDALFFVCCWLLQVWTEWRLPQSSSLLGRPLLSPHLSLVGLHFFLDCPPWRPASLPVWPSFRSVGIPTSGPFPQSSCPISDTSCHVIVCMGSGWKSSLSDTESSYLQMTITFYKSS